jgi:hypothetical protein
MMNKGPELVEQPDKVYIVGDGNASFMLRVCSCRARKGVSVLVEWEEDHPQGPMTVSREIDRIVVSGSGRITIHLKDV